MAITTMSQLADAVAGSYTRTFVKGSVTKLSNVLHSVWNTGTGDWPAGSLTVGNTTTGVVPTGATTGALPLGNNPGGSLLRWLTCFDLLGVAGQVQQILYDRLFHVGSVALTSLATTTLSSQPSYSARVPSDYSETEIMLELNAASSATATTVEVTYVNEAGTTGRTTGPQSVNNMLSGQMVMMPLQAGDRGVSKISSIIVGGTVATLGSVNVLVVRRLISRPAVFGSEGGSIFETKAIAAGMRRIYDDSCLALICGSPSTFTGTLIMQISTILG